MAEQKESFLKRGVSLGELIGFAITVISATVIFYTSVQVRLGALEMRMDSSMDFQKRVETKLDEIKDDVNRVKIEVIQNKTTK